MANVLKREKQEQVIAALVEGSSIRSTERMTGVHRDTITRLMIRVGGSCAEMMDASLRGLSCRHVQMDEIWCYVGKKQRHLQPEDNPRRRGGPWPAGRFRGSAASRSGPPPRGSSGHNR